MSNPSRSTAQMACAIVVFIFKLCLVVFSMEQTAQIRHKQIALRTDLTVSILLVWKVPLVYFSISGGILK